MAIYHFDARTISRGGGASASGTHDYMLAIGECQESQDRVIASGHGNMPKWANDDPSKYWEAADLYERQAGRLCKSLTLALPDELTNKELFTLIAVYIPLVTTLSDGSKLPYSWAVHRDPDTGKQTHLHLMVSERITDEIQRDFGSDHFKRYNAKNPEKGGAKKTVELMPRQWLLDQRRGWAEICNKALEPYNVTIDHRSLKDRGIDREPAGHLPAWEYKRNKQIQAEIETLTVEIDKTNNMITKFEFEEKNIRFEIEEIEQSLNNLEIQQEETPKKNADEIRAAKVVEKQGPTPEAIVKAYNEAWSDYPEIETKKAMAVHNKAIDEINIHNGKLWTVGRKWKDKLKELETVRDSTWNRVIQLGHYKEKFKEEFRAANPELAKAYDKALPIVQERERQKREQLERELKQKEMDRAKEAKLNQGRQGPEQTKDKKKENEGPQL